MTTRSMDPRPSFVSQQMAIARESPATWVCDINTVCCRDGHPLLTHKAGYHTNQSRVDGHVFHACEKCKPTSFFFGDVRRSRSGDPIITCWAITKEQYDYWNNDGRDVELEGGTLEMLFRLGHNPNWRPARRG